MARTPSGTTFHLPGTIGGTKPIEAVSNATEAVVTSTAHGFSNGDIVFITTSSWGRLNKRAFRAKNVSANAFTLEKADTTNTDFFPTGGGQGTVQKMGGWIQVVQVLSAQASGGEPKNVSYKYLDSDVEMQKNDGFSAVSKALEVDADSIGTPGYELARTLTDTQTEIVLRQLSKSGAVTLTPGTVALMEEEMIQDGQIVKNRIAFSGSNRSTRYAS